MEYPQKQPKNSQVFLFIVFEHFFFVHRCHPNRFLLITCHTLIQARNIFYLLGKSSNTVGFVLRLSADFWNESDPSLLSAAITAISPECGEY